MHVIWKMLLWFPKKILYPDKYKCYIKEAEIVKW